MNCIEGMRLIPKNKIDLIVTDPPFAINFKATKANYNRISFRVIQGYNEIKAADTKLKEFLKESLIHSSKRS